MIPLFDRDIKAFEHVNGVWSGMNGVIYRAMYYTEGVASVTAH